MSGSLPVHPDNNAGGEDVHAGPVEPYQDPGLPDHVHRLSDTDPKAAKRAERQVAGLFVLSAVMTVLFVVAYFTTFPGENINLGIVETDSSNLFLGTTLGVALLAIGVAAIHWAKKLMPDVEVVAQRHALRSPDDARADALQQFEVGADESGFGRRSLIRRSMIGSLALLPIPALVLLKDLGPDPGNDLARTDWDKGVRVLTDPTGLPVRVADLEVGALVNALPSTFEEIPESDAVARQDARARDAVIVVRMNPEDIEAPAGRENWGVDGVLVYSKICTHVGCPISLYERTTHHLLCPCHQSTFQLNQGGKVVFGPANRSLPQLAVTTDADGYLVAKLPNGFQEPVGPSYWERGEL